jgi:hypothetical protein
MFRPALYVALPGTEVIMMVAVSAADTLPVTTQSEVELAELKDAITGSPRAAPVRVIVVEAAVLEETLAGSQLKVAQACSKRGVPELTVRLAPVTAPEDVRLSTVRALKFVVPPRFTPL